MDLSTANTGGDFTPPPEGVHRAKCYRFIDLGTQRVEFKGEVKHQRKVMLSFELTDEMDEFDGQEAPFTVHQRFTWSMSEKGNLRPFLEAWRGRKFTDADLAPGGFNTKNLIGVPCMLNVTHTTKEGRTYANIASISPIPKALRDQPQEQFNDSVYLTLEKSEFDADVFASLSDKLRAIIASSPEYETATGRARLEDIPGGTRPAGGEEEDFEDTIPF